MFDAVNIIAVKAHMNDFQLLALVASSIIITFIILFCTFVISYTVGIGVYRKASSDSFAYDALVGFFYIIKWISVIIFTLSLISLVIKTFFL